MSARHAIVRWLELIALFGFIPLAFLAILRWQHGAHIALIPLLWVVAFFLLYLLSGTSSWKHRDLAYLPKSSEALRRILVRFAFVALALAVATYGMLPERFMHLPVNEPLNMLAIGVLYPLLSVLPQGVIYRVFMSERYACLFGSETAFLLFSAACFAGGHIIFQNWIAILATFAGGLLFMHTYRSTRSHLLASFEHALYGVFAFGVGLGEFLLLSAAR